MINFPEILIADLISPVVALPFLLFGILLAFFFNFVINFIVFSIGVRIFAKDEIKFPPSLLLILFITMSGFLMDFVGAVIGKMVGTTITGVSFFITAVIITVLISGSDFLIMKKYLKIDRKKILKLAIWIGVITNPMWLIGVINRLLK
jgi:hypothetical protein